MPTDHVARMFLVRHGATEWSVSGQHTGRTDLPLLDQGCQEAEAVGQVLAGRPFALVLTSPLLRAAETCALAGYGAVAETDDDLMEWDYGSYEGLTTTEIRKNAPGWSLWNDGVPEGERAAEVGQRVDRVIARARALEGDTLCVAHGHVLRVLAARWLGLPPVGGKLFALESGSVSVLDWDREDPVISRWNWVRQLPH